MKRIKKFSLIRKKIKNEGIMNSIFEDNKNITSEESEPISQKVEDENTTKEIINEDILEDPSEEDEEYIKKDILNLDLNLNKLQENIDANDIFFEEEKKTLENTSLEEHIESQDLKEVHNILTNNEEKLIIESSNISSESQLSTYLKNLESIEDYAAKNKLNNFFKIDKKLFNQKMHDFFILKTQINSYLKSNKLFIDKEVIKNINLRINNLKAAFYNVKLTKYSFYFLILIIFLLFVFVFFTLTAFLISGWWK
ncbi:hypothetical protein JTY60_02740 [symbiont of Argiope bruennichi]|uniref:hypothetical protein n=1 Tax=symbiont of Argiope bruennichi TaxID=2810479 RepID=UPI003DA598E2